MKTDQAKKLTEAAMTRLSEALAAGKSEALTEYLTTMARFHHYSFRNVMLIAMQSPNATRVAGFQTWKSMGRFVKKGEKGIVILAPMVFKPKDHSLERNTGAESEDDAILRFRAVYVFDIAQTEGDDLPELTNAKGDPGNALTALKALVAQKGIALEYFEAESGPLGCSTGGKILLRANQSPAEEFMTLVHELAHELLHRDNRPNKTIRETEAESVAFVVSHGIGLDALGTSNDYIQLYKGDLQVLTESLTRIQEVASEILAAILKQPEIDQLKRA